MNLVLFVGAGFSAPFGHPVMNDFLRVADESSALDSDDKALLNTLVLEARAANSFLESSASNLEDVLSFYEMGERLRLKDRGRAENLRHILRKVYTRLPLDLGTYWSRYQALHSLLGTKPSKFAPGTLAFVTTNYDLNIESACSSLGSRMDPGFALRRIEHPSQPVMSNLYDRGTVPLYKLHGSVNWYPSAAAAGGVDVDDRVVAVDGPWDAARGSSSLPMICTHNYVPPSAPAIVPPSYLKPELRSTLKAVWSAASIALAKANQVAFIGYSFPQSDTEMMFFLASAFSANAGLRDIHIVDPRAKEIVERLKASGSKAGSHFKSLLRAEPSEWSKATLTL